MHIGCNDWHLECFDHWYRKIGHILSDIVSECFSLGKKGEGPEQCNRVTEIEDQYIRESYFPLWLVFNKRMAIPLSHYITFSTFLYKNPQLASSESQLTHCSVRHCFSFIRKNFPTIPSRVMEPIYRIIASTESLNTDVSFFLRLTQFQNSNLMGTFLKCLFYHHHYSYQLQTILILRMIKCE